MIASGVDVRGVFGGRGSAEEADDRERGVVIRIGELSFQRLQSAPQDIRLGGGERVPQTPEPVLIGRRQVDLHGFRDPSALARIMNLIHDS